MTDVKLIGPTEYPLIWDSTIRPPLHERRERIATAALQGLMASMHCMFPGELARDAVDYADALIAELDKPEEDKT